MSKKESLGLDPKHYEPVSCDKEKIVLKHKKGGHEVHVALNALSPKFRQRLHQYAKGGRVSLKDSVFGKDKMAEGGDVKPPQPPIERVDKQKAADMSKGAMSGGPTIAEGFQNIKKGLGFAEGTPDGTVGDYESNTYDVRPGISRIEEYADDTEIPGISQSLPISEESQVYDEAPGVSIPDNKPISEQLVNDGRSVPHAVGSGASAEYITTGDPLTNAPIVPDRLPANVPDKEAPGLAPTPAPVAKPEPSLSEQGYKQLSGAIDLQSAALQNQAKAEAKAISDRQTALDDLQKMNDDVVKDLQATQEALEYDVKNNLVDPNKFWDGYTDAKGNHVAGHSRLAAAIGMLIAGFNPVGGTNQAADFLDKEIERNLQAQEKNLNTRQSLLRANLDKFKSKQDAILATRAMLNDDVQRRLAFAAANSKSDLAKAAAMDAKGRLQIQQHQDVMRLQGNQLVGKIIAAGQSNPKQIPALLNILESGTPEQQKQAQELRSRTVTLPEGTVFANTKEDAQFLRETEDRRTNIKANVESLLKAVKDKGTYEMFGPHAENLEMMLDQVATDTAKLQDPNSVARPNEVELVKKSLMGTGLFTRNSTAEKQLENFYKTVDDRTNQAYKGRGITPPSGALEETKTMNGVKYRKVPGGWQKAQ